MAPLPEGVLDVPVEVVLTGVDVVDGSAVVTGVGDDDGVVVVTGASDVEVVWEGDWLPVG